VQREDKELKESEMPDMTLKEPHTSSQPVPARNPPTTGNGINLIHLPRRKRPTVNRKIPESREHPASMKKKVENSKELSDDESEAMDPAISARIADMFASGPAMTTGDELLRETNNPITAALINAPVMPSCR
jgi:hypothetical protein